MANAYLSLWLEGSMQSWGVDSRHSVKDTLNFPTKSAILGILLASMGKSGEQTELLGELGPLDLQVMAYATPNVKPATLNDFHMVGSNYDLTDEWQALFQTRKFDGSKANGGSKLTYRRYLLDVCFGVVIEVPDHMKDEIIQGLSEPVYDIYLGRKSCVPTDFIYKGVFDSLEDAKNHLANVAEIKEKEIQFSVIQGQDNTSKSSLLLNDVPISFGRIKEYKSRSVSII
jgi:CRISPR system Cascade subunit CasD